VGRDSRFFAHSGYEVTSTDFSDAALRLNASKVPPRDRQRITLQKLDMRSGLPFPSQSFDIVYAHLSLHYFDQAGTLKIMGEIRRLLRYKGVFAFLANSINDPEFGTGPRIEEDFFEIGEERGTVSKRYFSVESATQFTLGFDSILLDNLGEAYGKNDRGVHNLIRFVGTKGDAQPDSAV
jgi:SAM-dependent methyltransferase